MPDRNTPVSNPPPPATRVCPYCGRLSAAAPEDPCPTCKMRDTPQTRAATTARVGPWYLLQARNPAAPGMNFATLLSLVRRGHITPSSVVRGPTTQQLWTLASQVKGVSREFGVCYACGQPLERASNLCPHCQRLQDPPMNPDALLEHKPSLAPSPPPGPPARPRHTPASTPPSEPDLGLPAGTLPAVAPRPPAEPQGRILTPRELAAAFALSTSDPAAAAAAAPESPAAAPTRPVPPRPRRRHPVRTVLLTATLFAAGALGAYAGIDPEFRDQARQSVTRATDWARAHLSETPVPPTARPILTTPARTPATTTATPSTHDRRAPIQPSQREEPSTTTPPTIRVDVGPPAGASARPAPALPTPAAANIKPSTPVPAPTPAPAPTAAEMDRSIELFRQALEAESRNDYATAVRLYQQIRQLPRATWPETLERRLAAAKLRSGQSE